MRRRIPIRYQQYKPLWVPVVVILLVIVLSLTLGRVLLGRVIQENRAIEEARQRQEGLSKKLDTLGNLNQEELQARLKAATTAVPSESPSLFAISALRKLATNRNLTINNLRFQAREETKKGALQSISITFDVDGGLLPSVFFLNDLRSSAPIVRVTRVKFNVSGSSALVNLQITAPWSALPTQLGRVDEPIQNLTSEEEEVLGRLEALRRPEISQVVPAPPQGRDNPFAF